MVRHAWAPAIFCSAVAPAAVAAWMVSKNSCINSALLSMESKTAPLAVGYRGRLFAAEGNGLLTGSSSMGELASARVRAADRVRPAARLPHPQEVPQSASVR